MATTTAQASGEPPRNHGGHYTPQELAAQYRTALESTGEVERLVTQYRDALAAAQTMPCEESERWVREAKAALANSAPVRRVRTDRWVNNPSPDRW